MPGMAPRRAAEIVGDPRRRGRPPRARARLRPDQWPLAGRAMGHRGCRPAGRACPLMNARQNSDFGPTGLVSKWDEAAGLGLTRLARARKGFSPLGTPLRGVVAETGDKRSEQTIMLHCQSDGGVAFASPC